MGSSPVAVIWTRALSWYAVSYYLKNLQERLSFLFIDGFDGCQNIRAISLKFFLICSFGFDQQNTFIQFVIYFKTSTFCLLFLSSYVFTALEFDGDYFDILLWKIVKQCDHKLPIWKIFQK